MAAFILAAEATAMASAASLVTFIFGDSLTEVGNNKYLQYSLARSDYPWYGIDFPGGKATGRFTNGRTIGDMICNTAANYLTNQNAKLIRVVKMNSYWTDLFFPC